MSIQFIGYLLIGITCSIFCSVLIYFGLKEYNDRDPIKRIFSKNMLVLGILGFIVILVALVDAWHS